jgi:predicted nucleic acid-binding protein
MKVFADANILVSVLNKEYPLYTDAARILSLADNKRFTVFTSPVCLAIAFYFSEKKSGTELAKQKISLLASKLSITNMGKREVEQALANKKVNDFEDGMQYYAAIENKCNAIITQDTGDYYYSTIEVLKAEDFLRKYVLK